MTFDLRDLLVRIAEYCYSPWLLRFRIHNIEIARVARKKLKDRPERLERVYSYALQLYTHSQRLLIL